MSQKQNCWEFQKCGRQPGGKKVTEFGICPTAIDSETDGLNDGKYGGRICWAVAGSFCGSLVQGTIAKDRLSCLSCDFFKKVRAEEGETRFVLLKPGQVYKASVK